MSSNFYLLRVYLKFVTFIFATVADVVPGKCPNVSGTKFNCIEVIKNFYGDDTLDTAINLVIYGFLPSSPDSHSLNAFAFDFQKDVNMSDYFVRLSCSNDTRLRTNAFSIKCGTSFRSITV